MEANLEAAVEIARQLRIRNLSGMIIADFMEMDSRANQLLLLRVLSAALASDPTQTKSTATSPPKA